ncbi:uncharacterized protein [Melanerpes formicivorus]|uniref:uncharacterized protein n=1 Tax=Melanerpes formicivorus TaxID=211600 RepID=UPI0035901B32
MSYPDTPVLPTPSSQHYRPCSCPAIGRNGEFPAPRAVSDLHIPAPGRKALSCRFVAVLPAAARSPCFCPLSPGPFFPTVAGRGPDRHTTLFTSEAGAGETRDPAVSRSRFLRRLLGRGLRGRPAQPAAVTSRSFAAPAPQRKGAAPAGRFSPDRSPPLVNPVSPRPRGALARSPELPLQAPSYPGRSHRCSSTAEPLGSLPLPAPRLSCSAGGGEGSVPVSLGSDSGRSRCGQASPRCGDREVLCGACRWGRALGKRSTAKDRTAASRDATKQEGRASEVGGGDMQIRHRTGFRELTVSPYRQARTRAVVLGRGCRLQLSSA